jgi:hypothetical protein
MVLYGFFVKNFAAEGKEWVGRGWAVAEGKEE